MNSRSVDLLQPGGTAATKSAVPSSAPSAPLDGARRNTCLQNADPKSSRTGIGRHRCSAVAPPRFFADAPATFLDLAPPTSGLLGAFLFFIADPSSPAFDLAIFPFPRRRRSLCWLPTRNDFSSRDTADGGRRRWYKSRFPSGAGHTPEEEEEERRPESGAER